MSILETAPSRGRKMAAYLIITWCCGYFAFYQQGPPIRVVNPAVWEAALLSLALSATPLVFASQGLLQNI